MVNVNNCLVVIPAREGSKGVPGKNIKELNGKPLIQYTIDSARKVFKDKAIYVSTDSNKIKLTCEKKGLYIPFLRPSKLATDNSSTQDVLLHALEFFKKENGYEPIVVILLQPTSPFRTSEHIKEAIQLYTNEIDMVVSVKKTSSNPYYVLFEEDVNSFLNKSKKGNFTRRQDCPKVWELNGAIYIINTNSLKSMAMSEFTKVKKYEMDELSSHDIDTILDWEIANVIKNKYYSIQ